MPPVKENEKMKSLIIAFSMYSKIPMPHVQWDEEGMRYALCFLPVVGAVVGAVLWLVGRLLLYMGVGSLLFACVMTVIPVLVTGGIHLDGFLDTMDGINSFAPKEKRLEILKDPNCGAFGVIGGLVYFTLSVGLWSQAGEKALLPAALSCVLSRSLGALSVVCFPKAKKTGLAAEFGSKAAKKTAAAVLVLFALLSAGMLLFIQAAVGLAMLLGAALCFLYHYYNCRVNFDGITGDLAGFFIQLCELVCLGAAVLINMG